MHAEEEDGAGEAMPEHGSGTTCWGFRCAAPGAPGRRGALGRGAQASRSSWSPENDADEKICFFYAPISNQELVFKPVADLINALK